MPDITNIPAPRTEFIDPRTGLMAREWYRFFLNLFQLTGSGSTDVSISDLQVVPLAIDQSGLIGQVSDAAQLASASRDDAQFTELVKRIEALEETAATALLDTVSELTKRVEGIEQNSSSSLLNNIFEAVKRIEALEAAPVPQPYVKRSAYGSFYDTTTQTAAAINTAYAMTFNTTDLSFGVTVGSPTSRITVDTTAIYNIQFSAQLDNTSGGNHLAYIWLRINGTDVANSAAQVRLKGIDGELVAAWNYVELLKANDYFEIMWSVTDIAVQITASAAVAPVPAIPSVILTVTNNINS